MASAFSAPDASIISHTPSLDPSLLASTSKALGRSISDLYDVPFTIQRILQGGFKRVALQFSDEGLSDSVPIYWELKNGLQSSTPQGQTPADLFLLADTSYGNCCVDEVAAAHVEADVVVHYGHACLSPTARLPVVYVFPKKVMKQVEGSTRGIGAELAKGAREALDGWEGEERKTVLLTYDVGYAYAAEQVYQELAEELQNEDTGAEASGSTPSKLPPLILATLDTARNFENRIARPIPPRQVTEPQANSSCRPDGTCATNGSGQNGTSCCSPSPTNGVQTNGSSCCSGGSSLPPLPSSTLADPERLAGGDGSGRLYHLPPDTTLSDCLILYLGSESLALTNLLLRAGPTTPVLSYNPSDPERGCRREDGRTNRLLMRRYAAVQKARDAEVVGLLVGTLGVQSYLPLLAHLRQLLTGRRPGESKTSSSSRKSAGRKVYTISVGKLNPAKLANFQEVDVFVLLACPENSLVDAVDPTGLRSKEFYKPIVTPFEMMLALDEEGRGWTGEYVLEMERLLSTQEQEEQDLAIAATDGSLPMIASAAQDADEPEQQQESDDDDQPHFSLVTGKYVSRRKFRHNNSNDDDDDSASDDQGTEQSGVITLRDSTSSNGKMTRILDSANARHLATRSWKGLEQRLGLDEPSVLEEGRSGIAKGYAEADGTKEG